MTVIRRFSAFLRCGLFSTGLLWAGMAAAERPAITPAMAPFVSERSALVALTHVRVIDGTGAPVRQDQTIILRDDRIEHVGPSRRTKPPRGAKVIDLSGRTALPGLVQLHEHLWMFGGSLLGVPVSYPRLMLAAGVTSIRTAGSYNNYADLRAKKNVEAGRDVGPWMDLSIYMDLFGAPRLFDAEATRKYLGFWLDSGFTSVKAYGYTNAIALRAAIDLAHSRKLKVTGHLCGVSYAEAAAMGIDDIEHGFAMAPDFLPEHPVALSPDQEANSVRCGEASLHALDGIAPDDPKVAALIAVLVARKVAVTSTLPAIEDLTVDIPAQPGLDMLLPEIREHNRKARAAMRAGDSGLPVVAPDTVRKAAAIERAFMQAGGLLVSGTDPAVPSGGVVAGYSSARQIELMVENGFTPLEAIRVSTLNGAIYLGRDTTVGSIAPGKQADLMIVQGDPSTRIADIRNVEIVFKQGLGYDPAALRASVRGMVGLK